MFPSWTRFGMMFFLVAAAVAAACGCSSKSLKEQAALASASMQETSSAVEKVADQIDVTVSALNDLAEKPQANLKPQYETFAAAVEGLKTQAELTKIRADEMRAKGTAYFDAWKKDSEAPVSPELKASYDKITEESGKARDAFDPFLDSLADIQKLLGMDLTATGINLIQDLVKKANMEAQEVKQRIQAVSGELDKVAKLLAPAESPSS